MTLTADQLVDKYLERLNRELADLPRARRREVVEEIKEHIAEARAALPAESEADVRNLLDRVGDPSELAADARDRFGLRPSRAGAREIAALVLLLVGGFLMFVGWVVGVVLLWASDAWNTRDKLIGTLVLPGGLVLPLALFVLAGTGETCSGQIDPRTHAVIGETCTGGPSLAAEILAGAVLVALVLAPIVTSIYLARRMRRPAVAAA
jgi:hypothetical protein